MDWAIHTVVVVDLEVYRYFDVAIWSGFVPTISFDISWTIGSLVFPNPNRNGGQAVKNPRATGPDLPFLHSTGRRALFAPSIGGWKNCVFAAKTVSNRYTDAHWKLQLRFAVGLYVVALCFDFWETFDILLPQI